MVNGSVDLTIGKCVHSAISFNDILHSTAEDDNFKKYLYDDVSYNEMNGCFNQAIDIYALVDIDCIWLAIKANIKTV